MLRSSFPVRGARHVVASGLILAAVVAAGSVAAAPSTIDRGAAPTVRAVRVGPPDVRPGVPDAPPLPAEAALVDTSRPDVVVGTGTSDTCTSDAVVAAVAEGGVITFDCGTEPVRIDMTATAKVVNTSSEVVLDGGGRVTLDGLGERRILYMNTCDREQIWTTSHCQNQDQPRLTIQRIAFERGDSTGERVDGGGGGAVFVRGGQVTIIESSFVGNRCDPVGPDVAGGAVRVLSQFEDRPVVVANSLFTGNECSNGGATASIGVSWRILNSTFVDNRTTGNGANPQRPGTPGGGNGGAIYLDGNDMTLELVGSVVRDNVAREGGGAVFFVSNDRTGRASIDRSILTGNPSLGFETRGFPGIFHLGSGPPVVTDSTLE